MKKACEGRIFDACNFVTRSSSAGKRALQASTKAAAHDGSAKGKKAAKNYVTPPEGSAERLYYSIPAYKACLKRDKRDKWRLYSPVPSMNVSSLVAQPCMDATKQYAEGLDVPLYGEPKGIKLSTGLMSMFYDRYVKQHLPFAKEKDVSLPWLCTCMAERTDITAPEKSPGKDAFLELVRQRIASQPDLEGCAAKAKDVLRKMKSKRSGKKPAR